MTMKKWEVGGCVRDDLLGVPSKDIDFVVVAPDLDTVVENLTAEGFKIHVVTADKFTVRAGVPEGHPLRSRCRDADFVLARRDGPYSDGRRPDWVEPGTLADDLARRDFTVNAIARDPLTGEIIDPHGGRADLADRLLRFVGDPRQRITEDGLRVLRGFRFMITKGFVAAPGTREALDSEHAVEMMGCVSSERIRDEVNRMLAHDSVATVRLFEQWSPELLAAVFREGITLEVTMRAR